MSLGYSASQLLRYHSWARANPDGRILPPGGRKGWDDMSVSEWLAWFWERLTAKINRGLPAFGKGNRAAKRLGILRDAKAECKWCGEKTGSAAKRFCCDDCARSYYS